MKDALALGEAVHDVEEIPGDPLRPGLLDSRWARQPRLTCPGSISACKTLGCCIEEARLTR
jgi:hypothetical protein